MPADFACPNGRRLLIPSQAIETIYPTGRGHLTLPLHADGSLCGPWCADAAEQYRRSVPEQRRREFEKQRAETIENIISRARPKDDR